MLDENLFDNVEEWLDYMAAYEYDYPQELEEYDE